MRAVNIMSGILTCAIVAGGLIGCTAFSQKEQVECLAKNVYFEARGESQAGQIAVANVTMNRVSSKHFPNTVCDVVWEPKQFSWTHDGKSDTPGDSAKYKDIYKLAKKVYNNQVIDITEGSTFYHADYVNPSWNQAMDRVTKIGTHIFYKHEGR
jgi:N-acetylmuramoyl-L-alanine amidase